MTPDKIRSLRLSHGLSVAEAARLVKVTDRNWRRWEDGTRPMPEGAWDLFLIRVQLLEEENGR